jgi:hypothetical protein
MRQHLISLILSMAVVGGGAWWVERSNAAVASELKRLSALASQPARDPAARCVMTMDTGVLKSELQRALSSVSLAPAASAGTPAAADATRAGELSPEAEAGPSPDAVAAFDEAGAMLDTSLGRGTWTSADAMHFRQVLVRLDPDGRRTMALRLVKAMNEGKLRATAAHREGF